MKFYELVEKIKSQLPDKLEQMAEDYVTNYCKIMTPAINVGVLRNKYVANLTSALRQHLHGRSICIPPGEVFLSWWIDKIDYQNSTIKVCTHDDDNDDYFFVPILSTEELVIVNKIVIEITEEHNSTVKVEHDKEVNKQKRTRRELYLALKKRI